MTNSQPLKHKYIGVIALFIALFLLMWWLFNFTIPEVAVYFSLGFTCIVVGGLLVGSYVSRWGFKLNSRSIQMIIALLVLFIITSCVGIGLLVNRMIDDTLFFHFLMTLMLLFAVSIATGTAIRLIRFSIKRTLKEAETAMTHSKSELQLLQSQLSPHFLFNTLNNLYGLALAQHPKLPELLLKLSELLRYSVYDTKLLFVPLQQEIDYLNNYIAFEKLRLGKRLHLVSNLDEFKLDSWQIAPMLLVVFVENAFKHSKNASGSEVHIEIELHAQKEKMVFSIQNSIDTSVETKQPNTTSSGFGLETTKKRLKLLYEFKHQLQINTTENKFEVLLTLNK